MKELKIDIPTSYSELTQEQLRQLLDWMVRLSPLEVKIRMLLRWCGIGIAEKTEHGFRCYRGKEVFYLQTWQVQWCIQQLQYIDRYEEYDVRLDAVAHLVPVDAMLHKVPFKAYLAMEKYYQGFIRNKENTLLLERLGQLLYTTADGDYDRNVVFSEAERMNAFLWFAHVKTEFSKFFPHFFRPAVGNSSATEQSIIGQMNIQIRALTGGDVTKEEYVMNIDCWRALTELDAKALESEKIKNRK